MNVKRHCQSLARKLFDSIVVGVLVWVIGLASSFGLAYLFTDIKDYETLAKRAGTVVMKELRANKKEVVETVQVLAKEYRAQDPEAVRRYLYNHKDVVTRFINESFPGHREDIKEILAGVSQEAQEETKKILNEIVIADKEKK